MIIASASIDTYYMWTYVDLQDTLGTPNYQQRNLTAAQTTDLPSSNQNAVKKWEAHAKMD
ncbi:hypothetical protein ACLOJK_014436 [Asimina triloba]